MVGTSKMWCWTGLHCEGRGLLKKAARNGFRGCIHSTGDPRRLLGRSPLAYRYYLKGAGRVMGFPLGWSAVGEALGSCR